MRTKITTSTIMLSTSTVVIPVQLRISSRARQVIIRIDPKYRIVELVKPKRTSLKQAKAFLETKTAWIEERLKELPQRIEFAHGVMFSLQGKEYTVQHAAQRNGRNVTWLEGDTLYVTGEASQLNRRVRLFLQKHAREVIQHSISSVVSLTGSIVKRITVRDTRSRWGSCSSDGNLSFSWRLVFAPREVLDYVVAHEIAHLQEMNHSPDFWRIVANLCPEYMKHRKWLKDNGAGVHLYG